MLRRTAGAYVGGGRITTLDTDRVELAEATRTKSGRVTWVRRAGERHEEPLATLHGLVEVRVMPAQLIDVPACLAAVQAAGTVLVSFEEAREFVRRFTWGASCDG